MQIQRLLTFVYFSATAIAAVLPATRSYDFLAPRSPVVDGKLLALGDYPFVVSIYWYNEALKTETFLCGGSLLSSQLVLTARRCFHHSFPAREYIIYAGSTIRGKGKRIRVQDILYPSVSSRGKSTAGGHVNLDVAMVILGEKVLETKSIGYAKLPDATRTYPSDHTLVMAMGWGMLDQRKPGVLDTPTDYPKDIRGVFLTTIPQKECVMVNNRQRQPLEFPLCVHSLIGDKRRGTCEKDTGGPIVDRNRRLLGIVNWYHPECGVPGAMTMSTSVSHLLPWIQSIMRHYGPQ